MKEYIVVMQNLKNQFINIHVKAESKEDAYEDSNVQVELKMGSRLISISEIKEWLLMLNALIAVIIGLSVYIVKEIIKEHKTNK